MRKQRNLVLLLLSSVLVGAAISACSSNQAMPGAAVGSYMDDSYITSAVKTRLLGNTGLKAFHIHVTTKDQVVTLSGTLPNTALRDTAVQTTKSVGGVKGVVDDIQIGSGH